MAEGVYCVPNRERVSIVCLTGQGCLFCAPWDTGYLIWASYACWCLFGASWDAGYVICASQSSGCIFCAQQGKGVYCAPHRTGVSTVCLLRHMRIKCVVTQDSGLVLCAWEGSRSVLCAQKGRCIYCVPHRTGVSILCLLGHRVSNMCLPCMLMSIRCLLWQNVSNMSLTWQWVSILCSTGQDIYCVPRRRWMCILRLLGHRGFWYLPHMAVVVYSVLNRAGIFIVWFTGQGCLFSGSRDTGYMVWASQCRGCLLCARQGRGIYCVPHMTGVPIMCLLWHRVSNLYFTCIWISILCLLGQRYLICASHGSGCLFYAQQSRGIYCVPHRTGVSILCLLGHRVSNMDLTWQRVTILCPTGQWYLLCASHDRGTYSVPPATHGT